MLKKTFKTSRKNLYVDAVTQKYNAEALIILPDDALHARNNDVYNARCGRMLVVSKAGTHIYFEAAFEYQRCLSGS
eukprot:1180823-Prorocentrum_minimum.AAC.1